MRRHPEGKFFNMSISDADIFSSDSFDVVVSFSMLEHLAEYESALTHMVRITRRHLFVTFFEGLSESGKDKIVTHPFDAKSYSFFGNKFNRLQNSYASSYYWNKYSKSTIEKIAHRAGAVKVEFFSASNREYLSNETILHVTK
jgi:ubiquinone/menaquinone biosynthesis C-methylase UbiE